VRYLINAGTLEPGSWYGRSDTQGSRFVGEGGHFVDTISWLLGVDPESVYACATPGRDDVQVSLRYTDGSTAVITYAASGAPGFAKETIDLLADGKVLRLDDFSKVTVVRGRRAWTSPKLPRGKDKGQREQLNAFLAAVRTGAPMPISLPSLTATARATFAVDTSLGTGVPVPIGPGGGG
jgi:predicted dehydrogenase